MGEILVCKGIIHLCDTIDIIGNTGGYDQQNWEQAKAYLVKYENTIFDAGKCEGILRSLFRRKICRHGRRRVRKTPLGKGTKKEAVLR